MLIRRFFTPSGNGFGPDFLGRSRIRMPLTVVIIVISFSSSIKPKRSSFSSRQPTCLVSNTLWSLRQAISFHIFRFHLARAVTLKPGKSAILFLPTSDR